MNWDAIGAVGEIIGAIAVVASLVFVGFQLRQNTTAMKLASTNDVMGDLEKKLDQVSGNEVLADLVFRGVPDPDSLSAFDRYRFTLICQSTYFYFAKTHYQYRSGTLEPEVWEAVHSQLTNFINSPGMAQYWKNHGHNFPKPFREYINDDVLVGADEGWSLAGTGMPTPKPPEP